MSAKGLSIDRFDRISNVLDAYVQRGEVAGFGAAVRRGDQTHVITVGVQSLDSQVPMQRETIFRVASVTKILRAVAAMILVEETKLRLDDPVDSFLPELADRRVDRTIESSISGCCGSVLQIALFAEAIESAIVFVTGAHSQDELTARQLIERCSLRHGRRLGGAVTMSPVRMRSVRITIAVITIHGSLVGLVS